MSSSPSPSWTQLTVAQSLESPTRPAWTEVWDNDVVISVNATTRHSLRYAVGLKVYRQSLSDVEPRVQPPVQSTTPPPPLSLFPPQPPPLSSVPQTPVQSSTPPPPRDPPPPPPLSLPPPSVLSLVSPPPLIPVVATVAGAVATCPYPEDASRLQIASLSYASFKQWRKVFGKKSAWGRFEENFRTQKRRSVNVELRNKPVEEQWALYTHEVRQRITTKRGQGARNDLN